MSYILIVKRIIAVNCHSQYIVKRVGKSPQQEVKIFDLLTKTYYEPDIW